MGQTTDIEPEQSEPIGWWQRLRQSRYFTLGYMLLACLVVVTVAGVWFLAAQKRAQQVQPQPAEEITIGNIGEYSVFNLISQNRGYFNNHGLNATIKEYPSGPPAVAALLDGKVDFAVAADFVGVNNIFANPHLRILAQVSRHKTFTVIARTDKGIHRPADLKGKKLGVVKKSAAEFFLGRFLALHDLKPTDLQIVDATPAEMITQIDNGQLDAIVIFQPHAYNLEKSLGNKVVSWSAQGDEDTLALLYTTDDVIRKKPAVVQRYVASLVEAETWLHGNDEQARESLGIILQYSRDYINYIWPKFDFTIALNQSILLTLEDQARWAIANKLTTQTAVPNYLDYIYFDALAKVKPQAVTIVH